MSEKFLQGLDDEQRVAAQANRGPVAIIAGAGTGKTRTITSRIAFAISSGVTDPSHTLALTYTTRAAAELRLRLAMLGFTGVQAHTFHSAAWRQLQYFWSEAIGGKPFRILSNKAEIISSSLASVGRGNAPINFREISSEIEWAKGLEIGHEDYARIAQEKGRVPISGFSHQDFAQVYEVYENLKQENRQLDFEDILLLMVGLLEEQNSLVDRVRAQYRFFTVDEYQDISPLQQHLLNLWLGKRQEICVVGDPDQSIFSFSGSTNKYLLEFPKRFSSAQVFRLNQNYRSSSEIIHVANKVMERELFAVRGSNGIKVRLSHYKDEENEKSKIVEKIKLLIQSGIDSREIAILGRRNDYLHNFADILTSAGVPVNLVGPGQSQRAFFYDGKVKEAIRLLRGAAIAKDPDSANVDLSAQVIAVLSGLDWHPDRARGDDQRLRLLEFTYDFQERIPNANLRDLITEIDEREKSNIEPEALGVVLSSIHSAKGLEWKYVFMPFLREGVLPISHTLSSPELIEEELRLFYVGITRAKDSLQLSYSGSDSSQFLRLLPALDRD